MSLEVVDHLVNPDLGFALNAENDGHYSHLLNNNSQLVCRSSSDNQMILFFPFTFPVKLSSITISSPVSETPTIVKLFPNRRALGFDDLDDIEATQAFKFDPDTEMTEKRINLNMHKFSLVSSLFVFVERADSDTVALSSISFSGRMIPTPDMSMLTKLFGNPGTGA